ncbi:MAG: glycoside hydrolase family 35 protein [Blautia sp.]|nr:beta-galactosidase family protein [Blautia sp. NSJ-175]
MNNAKFRKEQEVEKFEIREDFYLDGKKIKIISGGMHYFRVVPEYWRDRLEKLKALGCNTVETYIPWNLHEKEKGQFDFDGILDITRYVKTAQELGLMVILRPSPYICAEWEFGGLPYWLLKEDNMRLRCMYEPYLKHVREYYEKLFRVIAPLQITQGGPVIMMQVENEYGYYGDDREYLEYMKNLMIDCGCEVPLVTSDGPWGDAFDCGKVEGVLQTGNFGSKGKEQFSIMREKIGDKPLMCMEFWVGWFDNWGVECHQTGDLEEHVKDLDEILSEGHVNIYMFEGGTNFGFTNGSNYYDVLTPDVTSYDYDALLTEDGRITPKYQAFRQVISKYAEVPEVALSTEIKRKDYGTLKVSRRTGLFGNLKNIAEPAASVYPRSMEKLGQGYGYIMYESPLKYEGPIEKIRLWGANDRANMFVDEKPVLTLYDRELLTEYEFESPIQKGEKISILMENMGRVNFGPALEQQRKGIDRSVQINGHQHYYWTEYCLPMEDLSGLNFDVPVNEGEPGFYEFTFEAEETGDTFLDFSGWGKGCVLVNGFNIGRFWEIGPQKRLYIPGPLLKKGQNTILIFETEGKAPGTIALCEEPDLG